METLLTILHITVAVFMILVVLVQGGNQGGVGAAFGGGNSQGVFGASGATTLLGKLTYAAAAVFMATSLSLSVYRGGSVGFDEKSFNKPAVAAEASVGNIPAEKAQPEGPKAEKGK